MLFFRSKIYFPRHSLSSLEKKIDRHLKAEELVIKSSFKNRSFALYQGLFKLKKQAANLLDDLSQLQAVMEDTELQGIFSILDNKIKLAIDEIIKIEYFCENHKNKKLDIENLQRLQQLLQDFKSNHQFLTTGTDTLTQAIQEHKAKVLNKFSLGTNLVTNSFLTFGGIVGIIGSILLTPGSLGMFALGLALAVTASVVTAFTLYSLYVEEQFIANGQMKEIKFIINDMDQDVNNLTNTNSLNYNNY